MRFTRRWLLLSLAPVPVSAQEESMAGWERVELRGVIRKIHIEPGGGVPSLELDTPGGARRVLLGSRRYLMENNFNPKAGSVAVVKGFRGDGVIVAQQVELPAEKVSLRLRTDKGIPLWRGGWRRRRK
jgi:hypothetical protein